MSVQDFFVEIGTEELPPKALKTLATAFSDNIVEELAKQNLSHGDVSWYAAPRRLAVRVNQLALQQQDKVVEKRGNSYIYHDEKLGVGREVAKRYIKDNPKLLKQMRAEVMEAVEKGEAPDEEEINDTNDAPPPVTE